MVLPRGDSSSQGGRSTGGGSRGIGEGDGASTSGVGVQPAAPVRSFGNAVSLPAVEKLKGRQNYDSWSFAMKMILIREGTWRAVKPAENQDVDPEMCERALATICLSLEKQNYRLVKTAKTSKEAWDMIQHAFQDNGLIRRFGILDKLTSIKLEECESVEDYVDQLVVTDACPLNSAK